VYDTGGLSIKSSEFMVGMKRDMGGAAGVLPYMLCCLLSPLGRLLSVLCSLYQEWRVHGGHEA
jgi:leucyl aminopeptidase